MPFFSEFQNKKIGTHGNLCIFSLQAIKHLTTGDGGLIFLPNKNLYNKAKLLRWYGIDRDKRNFNKKDLRLEHDIIDWGYKFHMNDINATIGLYNLPHIKNIIKKNRENADFFYKNLENINGLELMENRNDSKSAYWLFTIKINNKNKFIDYMKTQNIMCSQVHQRNDIHTCFNKFKSNLPILDSLETKMVCIPVGWWINDRDRNYIIENIKKYLEL